LGGDATNGWIISWKPPYRDSLGFIAKFGINIRYNNVDVNKTRYIDLVFVSRKYNGVFSVAYCDIPPMMHTVKRASHNWVSYEYYGVTATLNMTTSGEVTIAIPPIYLKQTNTTGDVIDYDIPKDDVTLTLRMPNSIVYFN
jgi:hypothetical protein